MIARLIGIIGSTHGVRLSASPPMKTIARIANGPRPSKMPLVWMPASASPMNSQELVRIEIAAGRSDDGEVIETGEGGRGRGATGSEQSAGSDWGEWRRRSRRVDGLPVPNAMPLKTSACSSDDASAWESMRTVHAVAIVRGRKQTLSSHAWYRSRAGIVSSPGEAPFGSTTSAPITNSCSNTASGSGLPSWMKSVDGGKDDLAHLQAGRAYRARAWSGSATGRAADRIEGETRRER